MDFTPSLFSTKVNSGKRTFFFDVRSAKNSKPYIKITEDSVNKEGEKQRKYMTVFDSEVGNFKQAVDEVANFIQQQSK